MTAPTQVLDVAHIGDELLKIVIEQFAAAAVELPARRHLVAGVPEETAWDCEQLTVGLAGIDWGPGDDLGPTSVKIMAQTSAWAVRHAVFAIQLVRCTPSNADSRSGKIPAEDIHLAGQGYMRDAAILSQAVVAAVTSGRLGRSGMAKPGVVGGMGPTGGLHGVQGTITITIGETD